MRVRWCVGLQSAARGVIALASAAILISCGALDIREQASEQTDITFVVAGKTSNHRQNYRGEVSALNYHFFAEIFLQEGGIVTVSSIETPLAEGVRVPFQDSGYAMEMHGGRYASEAELEASYPDGDYVFRYTAPSVGTVEQIVYLG